ncbi:MULTISPECIES: hypothetical protein [Anaerolinea]|jgi:hypothetical protein|uniref:hypothetical protein n=1 Tax=Anaerolinea TaxID=233189 RepID=UPI002626E128|nr:hypothetical protein [Anaerolinea thermophila]
MSEIDAQEKRESPAIEIQGVEKRVIGDRVVVKQGAVTSLEANEVVIRQGGVVFSKTSTLSTQNSGIVFSQAQQASFSSSATNLAIINGNASLDQSGAKVLIVNGNTTLDQSGSVVLAGKEIRGENINTVFLFGQHVHGNVQSAFGTKESILFGIVAGIVSGIIFSFSRIFFRRKK